jgi:hypothetical protein
MNLQTTTNLGDPQPLVINYRRLEKGANTRTKLGFGGSSLSKTLWIRLQRATAGSTAITGCYAVETAADADSGSGNQDLNKDFCERLGTGGSLYTWDATRNSCVLKNNVCAAKFVFEGISNNGSAICRSVNEYLPYLVQPGTNPCTATKTSVQIVRDSVTNKVSIECTAGAATCSATTVNWTQSGSTCSAAVATGAGPVAVSDSTAPTTGTGTATCSAGTWSATGSCTTSCTPQPGSPYPTPTVDEDCNGNMDNVVTTDRLSQHISLAEPPKIFGQPFSYPASLINAPEENCEFNRTYWHVVITPNRYSNSTCTAYLNTLPTGVANELYSPTGTVPSSSSEGPLNITTCTYRALNNIWDSLPVPINEWSTTRAWYRCRSYR